MRLSKDAASEIRRIVRTYDPSARVKLFGSQVRDDARGGDIDLLVLSSRIGLEQRLRMESDLQDLLGLRRIDIVVAQDLSHPFVRLAERQSLELQ